MRERRSCRFTSLAFASCGLPTKSVLPLRGACFSDALLLVGRRFTAGLTGTGALDVHPIKN